MADKQREVGTEAAIQGGLQVMDNYTRFAKVHLDRYLDGDTIEVTIDLGCKVFKVERVRLAGINAPELYGVGSAAGKAARDWLFLQLHAAKEVTIATTKGAFYDKYGRYLAVVFADGRNLNEALLAAGHATRYVAD